MRNGIDWRAYLGMAKRVEAEALDAPTEPELLTGEAIKPEVIALYETGYRHGHSTGWPGFDEFYTVRPGEFTVITGIPGHGKSSWLDNLMVNLARNQDWRWAVFSAENFPVSRHSAGLLEIYTGRPFTKGPNIRMTEAERDDGLDWLGQHFRFIQPREDRYSLDRIVQIAFSVGDIDALVIDPWNELDHSRPPQMREDEFISVSLTKLRWLARNSEIHVFVVAHPAKYIRQKGEAKPVITLNEVKGASEWYAKADNGLSVWRDEADTSGATDVHIQKIRFKEVGRAGGAVRLYYDRVTGRFTDPSERTKYARYTREPGDEE
jgi:twinkle protein